MSAEQKYTDFGYELLRKGLLPELLNEDHDDIMYWGGKLLARKNPLDHIDDIPLFFERAGWGTIEKQKEGKKQWLYELKLMPAEKKPSFSRHLEAGFLAGQFELFYETTSDAIIEIKRNAIKLHVHMDPIR